ncbi:MAG: hypothetical protein ACRDZU_10515 [Acidimicrobiales bacterium]
MDRRRWVIVTVVALAAFVGAFMFASRNDDDDRGVGELDIDDLDALTVEARELVTRAEQGGQVTHHAVYEQSGGHRFEVWTDGERVREETTPAQGERRLLLRNGSDVVACLEEADAWVCDETDEPVADVQSRMDQLVADLVGAEVVISNGTIADLEVQCFEISGGEEAVEICLTQEGVLARLAAGDDRLELVSLDDDVDDSRFEPPDE